MSLTLYGFVSLPQVDAKANFFSILLSVVKIGETQGIGSSSTFSIMSNCICSLISLSTLSLRWNGIFLLSWAIVLTVVSMRIFRSWFFCLPMPWNKCGNLSLFYLLFGATNTVHNFDYLYTCSSGISIQRTIYTFHYLKCELIITLLCFKVPKTGILPPS